MLTFSEILKLQKYKINVSVENPIKTITSYLEIQNVFSNAEYFWLKNPQKFELSWSIRIKIGFFTKQSLNPNLYLRYLNPFHHQNL